MKKVSIALRQKQEQKIWNITDFAQLIDEHLRTA